MTYKINGIEFPVQPTSGQWNMRKELGVDGNNRKIYEPVYSFQIVFDALSTSQFKQLYDFWVAIASSGTVSVDLPQKNSATYVFKTYTGCVIDEPSSEAYFEQNLMSAKLLVRNIVL